MTERKIQLNREMLRTLGMLSPYFMVIFDKEEIFFSYNSSNEKKFKKNDIIAIINAWNELKSIYSNRDSFEIWIGSARDQNEKCCNFIPKQVVFEGRPAVLAYLEDITHEKANEQRLNTVLKLRSAMLEVTQNIFHLKDINDIYDLILEKSIKVLSKASIGTILYNDKGILRIASEIGFTKNINSFNIPLSQSFLYQETGGKLDRIVHIPDLSYLNREFIPIENLKDKSFSIQSTLSTPIFINNDFWGMVCIDSIEINGFNEDDIMTMEFLKKHIEIALTNHFLYQEKSFLSKHDVLTNLYNRRYLEEYANKIIQRAERYGETFCIVAVDIDKLKKINDTYGHDIGDKVIMRIANILEANTRKSDVLSRVGGDEIVGIYLENDTAQLLSKYAEIKHWLKLNPLVINGQTITCQFSMGIASYPQDGKELDSLMRIADLRMYQQKAIRRSI